MSVEKISLCLYQGIQCAVMKSAPFTQTVGRLDRSLLCLNFLQKILAGILQNFHLICPVSVAIMLALCFQVKNILARSLIALLEYFSNCSIIEY